MNNCVNCQPGLDGKEQGLVERLSNNVGRRVPATLLRLHSHFRISLHPPPPSSFSSFFFFLIFLLSLSSLSLHFLISGFEYRFENVSPFSVFGGKKLQRRCSNCDVRSHSTMQHSGRKEKRLPDNTLLLFLPPL